MRTAHDAFDPPPMFSIVQRAALRLTSTGRPPPRAAARRGRASQAGRSPSAARSGARTGTPRGSSGAATSTGTRGARTLPRAPSGSRSRRSRRACRRRVSAVSASTPFPAAPSTNRSRNASSASWLRFRLIARRSPSASPTVKPASAIATSSTWSWKTTTPNVERSGSRRSSWSTGKTYDGSSRSRCRASMYGCTAFPWIGPGRTSATWTVMSSRFSRLRPQEALHLRAALDLERADRVRALDVVVDRRIVEGDPREVDHLVVRARDLLDAVLDRREHPEAEQVDLEEARVRAGVLVPLAELAARPSPRAARGRARSAAASRRSSRPGAARRGAAAPRSLR